ncbi:MAG: aminomethyltransferase family protein [Pseudomonadota bacterium]
MSDTLNRTSALASRHRALGSDLEDWNGMGTAWSYHTDPRDEHDAVRERAGMFDMSPLKKQVVRGPDAQAVLDHLTTRDMARLTPGRAAYVSVLTETGTLADDAIVSNCGDDTWWVVHGSGDTAALLQASAQGRNVSVQLDDDLHNVSVQGPASLETLNPHCDIDLAALAYFDHAPAALFGHPCRLSRTGYSGERGYEVFASASHIGPIWDALVDAGVMPCSFTALDALRIEAGLLFYGYDMTDEHTPWEAGLGFTVNTGKSDFRGKAAVVAAQGRERVRNVTLRVDHSAALTGGETLVAADVDVGVVNSPCFSHRLNASLALAHVRPDIADGAVLQVSGDGLQTTATVVASPVHDPEKQRTHAR